MCGIAGIISRDVSKVNDVFLNRMGNTLAHRGPDGQATWTSGDGMAGFCHRRLIIIDKSAAAAQPMHYAGGYTIIHNGEIYNYIELRDELGKKGYQFRTSSDTEVILAAYAEYKERCVEHFDGMFAFAIWDANEKTLFCARDRFGEKPFYYSLDDAFCFASEIKALRSAAVNSDRDNGMLLYFFGTGNTVDPSDSSRTFYRSIKKLPAAHWLFYNARTAEVKVTRYWDVSKKRSLKSIDGVLGELNELLTLSINRRLRSDVPLGTSLSGGLDSSCIAASLWALGVRDLKTFTASFPGFERDETANAKKVAAAFDFRNYTVQATADGFVNDFEKLVYHQDEPVASASVYAQFKVFELAARENVTVLLDGQGADEILAGYDHYRRWWMRSLFPSFTTNLLRQRTKRALLDKSLNREFVDAAINELNIVKPVVRCLNDLLYFDTFCSGLEQLLRYADRNSMAHGREVRLPFLNYELVEFIFSLPGSIKIHDGYTKWILRRLMSHKLPDEIVWTKRKIGFEPPQKEWMKHPEIQNYIRNAKQKLVSDGLLNKIVLDQRSTVSAAFDRHAREWRWMAAAAFIHNKVPENKKGV
jgi:asparagine synthase (glutamine-hydrolysing)